ncbi:flavodoxin domain-containing protein [Amycolatopsis sp. FDAARGOS 1241]|nr:flavodoxin domain-containing protein [Amycolatopsis sp. FDAARGOS 1241]
MRVLVAVATRHGATREIAEQIAATAAMTLEETGVAAQVEVVDAEHVTSLAGYDAVVLGSAVYLGHWLDSAQRLAHEHQGELRRLPVWLFSSGPVGQRRRPGSDPVDVSDVLTDTAAREHRLFGGRVERARLRFPERAVVAALRVKDGDNRDWPVIRAWARAIAGELAVVPRGRSAKVDRPASGAGTFVLTLRVVRPRRRRSVREFPECEAENGERSEHAWTAAGFPDDAAEHRRLAGQPLAVRGAQPGADRGFH